MGVNLPLDAQRYVDAAEGWLGLGDHVSANEELEQIPAELRAHPKVLLIRCSIYEKVKRWDACVDLAEAIVTKAPEIPDGWIRRSFALHELKRTQEALDKLLPAVEKFPEVWTIPYNLACYTCQLGRCDEAESWFKRAMEIDAETVKREAIDDPDLDPLWKSKENTFWKRT